MLKSGKVPFPCFLSLPIFVSFFFSLQHCIATDPQQPGSTGPSSVTASEAAPYFSQTRECDKLLVLTCSAQGNQLPALLAIIDLP